MQNRKTKAVPVNTAKYFTNTCSMLIGWGLLFCTKYRRSVVPPPSSPFIVGLWDWSGGHDRRVLSVSVMSVECWVMSVEFECWCVSQYCQGQSGQSSMRVSGVSPWCQPVSDDDRNCYVDWRWKKVMIWLWKKARLYWHVLMRVITPTHRATLKT